MHFFSFYIKKCHICFQIEFGNKTLEEKGQRTGRGWTGTTYRYLSGSRVVSVKIITSIRVRTFLIALAKWVSAFQK